MMCECGEELIFEEEKKTGVCDECQAKENENKTFWTGIE